MSAPARIVVIGADAADAGLIEAWGRAGDLPNLMALRGRSSWGRVENPLGLEAGSVWPTFHTGANPGHQPQFDAMRYFDAGRYDFAFYERDQVSTPIWSALSKAGKRCFVMDAPYAHLDPTIDGVCIVDWGAHVPAKGTGKLVFDAVPKSAAEEVLRLVGPDPAHGLMCDDRLPETIADYRRFEALHIDRIEKKAKVAQHFLAKGSWDYFEVVFCDLHCVGHHTWHINDRSHPRYDVAFEAALGEPLRACYRALDRAIGTLLAALDSRTVVVFYASHGMGPQYTGTGLLDRILDRLENGTPTGHEGRSLKSRLRAAWRTVPVEMRAKLEPLRRPFAGGLRHPTFLEGRERRRAFEVYANNSAGGVRLNLKGREANGLVEPSDYHATLDAIAADLRAIINVETGAPLVKDIVKVHERYPGTHVDQLPDLAVLWNKTQPIRIVSSGKIGTLWQDYADARTGDHTPDGLFMAAGPGVEPGALNQPVSPADFMPTFERLLGLAPTALDGAGIRALLGARVTA